MVTQNAPADSNMISPLLLTPADATAKDDTHTYGGETPAPTPSSIPHQSIRTIEPDHVSNFTPSPQMNISPSELLDHQQIGEQDPQPTTHSSTVASPSTEPGEFHLFPKLPLELRRMIWKHALAGPKVHQAIRDTSLSDDRLIDNIRLKPFNIPIMEVCRESNQIANEMYYHPIHWIPELNSMITYYDTCINSKEDILYLPNIVSGPFDPPSSFLPCAAGHILGSLVNKHSLAELQHIAIDLPDSFGAVLKNELQFLSNTNLKTLTVTLHAQDCLHFPLLVDITADVDLLPPKAGVVDKQCEGDIEDIRRTVEAIKPWKELGQYPPEVKVAVLRVGGAEGIDCCLPSEKKK